MNNAPPQTSHHYPSSGSSDFGDFHSADPATNGAATTPDSPISLFHSAPIQDPNTTQQQPDLMSFDQPSPHHNHTLGPVVDLGGTADHHSRPTSAKPLCSTPDAMLHEFDPLSQSPTSSFSLSSGNRMPPPHKLRPISSSGVDMPVHQHQHPHHHIPRRASHSTESSPTRLRYFSNFPAGAPPSVSEAGSDIIYHAPPVSGAGRENATHRMRRMSSEYLGKSGAYAASLGAGAAPAPGSSSRTASGSGGSGTASGSASRTASGSSWVTVGHEFDHPHSHAAHGSASSRRSIVDTLASSPLGSRWKRVANMGSLGSAMGLAEPEPPTRTAVPIDVSHTSPFASPDILAGTYVAPSGAPGFRPAAPPSRADEFDEWSGTNLIGRREITEPVLQRNEAIEIRPLLPARQRISDNWSLLFSLDQHGASLTTLYREVEKYARDHPMTGNLLVVRDGSGHTFGVFLNEPITKREGTYYGSGESFMFKFIDGASAPRLFRWTGRNQYVALCETGFISFGGGGTSYGLLLDSTFSRNSSATSPAFQNEVLCGGVDGEFSEKGCAFDCVGLEVWATGS